jgi:NAD(P)-dependent dehydrogenase (short-subunit alcohol dehydrogenase family)
MVGRVASGGRLAGRVAVVTGGASGIGLATVERFVSEGARVVFCDLPPGSGPDLEARLGPIATRFHHTRRKAGGAHDGDAIAERLGPAATFVPADVTEEAALRRVVSTALETYGGIDVMFNNAGIVGDEGPIIDEHPDLFDRTVSVNLKAVWMGIKLTAPHMLERGGSIIATSSAAALIGIGGLSAYSASKAGVIGMMRSLAVELAPYRIRVNCICPGRILTPMGYDNPLQDAPLDPESLTDEHRAWQPMPIVGEARHVADTATWLASDESEFVTGQAIVVDGGLVVKGRGVDRRKKVESDSH